METGKTDSTGAPEPVLALVPGGSSPGSINITDSLMDALADAMERRRARSGAPITPPSAPAPVPVPVAPVESKPEIDWKKEIQSVMSVCPLVFFVGTLGCALIWYIDFAASHCLTDKHAGTAAFVGFVCMLIETVMIFMSDRLVKQDKWDMYAAVCYIRNVIVFLVVTIAAVYSNYYVVKEVYVTAHPDGLPGLVFMITSMVILLFHPILSVIVLPAMFMVTHL